VTPNVHCFVVNFEETPGDLPKALMVNAIAGNHKFIVFIPGWQVGNTSLAA
jgi:hypothetical protein